MFGVGDKAFYPAHGVGIIEKIEKKVYNGVEESFYVLKIIDSGMKITIPQSKANVVGLRHLIPKERIDEVFRALSKNGNEKPVRHHIPWNRRQRDYHAKLRTGSIIDHAMILKELTHLQSRKSLSFGEKKLLEQVKKLVIKELAYCQDCSEDAILSKINSLLSS